MAPNLYGPYDEETEFRSVVLSRPMNVIKIGVKQNLLINPKHNNWTEKGRVKKEDISHQHYPNVDMLECPHCHSKICIE